MKIIGNSVGAPVPRTDYNQTDPTRADYLVGRELLEQGIEAAKLAAQMAATASLPKTGGTMTGAIAMGSNKITGLAAPTSKNDAATKQYADSCLTSAKSYADTCQLAAESYAYTVSEEVRQVAYARIRMAAPYNLLDNSDFSNPINQRGETSYTGSKYMIDRWRGSNSNTAVTVGDGYLNIKANSGTVYFFQLLPTGIIKPGGTYTVACTLRDGSVHFKSGKLNQSTSITCDINVGGNKVGVLMAQYHADKSLYRVYLSPRVAAGLEVVNAALYEGAYTADTLPVYQPKGEETERLVCQSYFRVVRNGNGYVNSGNAYIFFLCHMRVTPTATMVESGTVRAAGASVTPTSVADVTKYIGDSIRLTMAGEYGKVNYGATLFNATIQLSADL